MKTPLISIITPVFNAEEHIENCIDSVRNQVLEDFEHILVDDCSSDNSEKYIQKMALLDHRIRFHKSLKNSGPGATRNIAIKMARGRYIAFLDSDDTWYPDKLQKQIAFMRDNKYPFTFTSYDTMDESGKLLEGKIKAKPKITYKKALYKNPIGCLTVIYDTDFFGKEYMPEIMKRQDYALWLKLLKKTDAHGLDKILSTYRIRRNSISSNKLGLIKYEWMIYRKEEGLSFIKSVYFLVSAIILKFKSYF